MSDIVYLSYLIKKSGKSTKDLADTLGIHYQTLVIKLRGEREFKHSEILKIKDYLELNNEELEKVFF